MSKLTHDVVATIGEYKDHNGQTKKRYHTCGKCFTDDQGRQSIKLDAIPGPGWSGWLSLYPVDKQSRPQPESGPNHPDRVAAREAAHRQRQAASPEENEDDDIPF